MSYILTEEQTREAFRLCKSGKTLGEVAKQFFVHPGTITNAFKRYDLRLPRRAHPVKNLTTGERFPSSNAAARAYGLVPVNVRAVCKGERKTCGGMRWAYDEVRT